MRCCGKTVSTRFCPECGTKLGEPTDLRGLLAHLRSNQRATETIAIRRAEWIKKNHPGDATYVKALEKVEKRVAQWKAWADALEGLIASAATEP
jgi:hypothetical protein